MGTRLMLLLSSQACNQAETNLSSENHCAKFNRRHAYSGLISPAFELKETSCIG